MHGFRNRFWKRGDLDFAAVSDVDAAAFEKFIALARDQRNKPPLRKSSSVNPEMLP